MSELIPGKLYRTRRAGKTVVRVEEVISPMRVRGVVIESPASHEIGRSFFWSEAGFKTSYSLEEKDA